MIINKKKLFWLVLLVIAVGFLFWFRFIEKTNFVTVKIGGTTIQAELADTPEERVRGLSGREELGENEGMLFVFEESDYRGIWMKDMKFPLDILWINDSQQVVDIVENVSPDTYPQVFRPKKPASYVLEVNGGFVAKHSIQIGNTLEF